MYGTDVSDSEKNRKDPMKPPICFQQTKRKSGLLAEEYTRVSAILKRLRQNGDGASMLLENCYSMLFLSFV